MSTHSSRLEQFKRPSWKHPALLALVALAAFWAYQHFSTSDADRLGSYFNSSCEKAGAIPFAGGRSTLYRCSWTAASGAARSRCAISSDGVAYNVTSEARALFRAQGETPPC